MFFSLHNWLSSSALHLTARTDWLKATQMEYDSPELIARPDQDLAEFIPTFLSNRQIDLKEIREALRRKDFLFVSRTAHTLKGICRPYGFIHLETLSKNLEIAAQNQNLTELEALADQIEFYLQNVKVIYKP